MKRYNKEIQVYDFEGLYDGFCQQVPSGLLCCRKSPSGSSERSITDDIVLRSAAIQKMDAERLG